MANYGPLTDKLHAMGCVRDPDNDQALTLIFTRQPTNEEMAMIHDAVNMILHGLQSGVMEVVLPPTHGRLQ